MDKIKKFVDKISSINGIINTILGIIIVVSLIVIFAKPEYKIAIVTAFSAGGLTNIVNGLKLIEDPKKKSSGNSFVMMGIIMIILGFVIINIM